MSMRRSDAARYLLVGGGIVMFFLLHAYRVYGTDVALIDDAFIFFRYARHWAQGYGLVWNIGEPPVEGVSSLLYTAVLTAGIRLGIPVVTWATVVNLILALGTIAYTMMYAREHSPWKSGEANRTAWLSALFLVAAPPFVFWVGAGMDTILLTFLMLVTAFYTLHVHRLGTRCVILGILLSLLGMTRLDALPIGIYSLIAIALGNSRRVRKTRRCLLITSLTFTGLFGIFFIVRWWYFGWPLPNTFYAKMGGGWAAWKEGGLYVLAFLRHPGILPLWFLALLTVLTQPRWENVYTGGLLFLLLLRGVAAGGDWMPHFRLMVPLLPFLSVLAAQGVDVLTSVMRTSRREKALHAVIVGSLVLSLCWPSLKMISRTPWRLWRPLRLVEPMQASQYTMGIELRKHLCDGDTVALLAAGAAAYLNDDHRIIDMLGLSDVHIAHSAPVLYKGRWDSGHVRLDVDYLLQQRPEWIQLDTHLYPTPEFQLRDWMPPQRLWTDPRVRAAYELVPLRVQVPTSYGRPRTGYIFFLHRRDAPHCTQ